MEDFPYDLSKHAQERVAQYNISLEWIKRVLQSPQKIEPDKDDPQLRRAFGAIPEYDDRVLRVVYNPTTDSWKIVSAFFDRGMKGKL